MAQSKNLSLGNHIYLYQLLSSHIPCGRQTFIPQVESILEAADLSAEDLGFESTRELLEELDDFIKLTVFKGGRVYATIIAQPSWDEALAASAKKNDAPQGKSWKKRRGDKTLKAVRPRHVPKAPEPAPEPEPVAEPEPVVEAAAEPEAATETATQAEQPEVPAEKALQAGETAAEAEPGADTPAEPAKPAPTAEAEPEAEPQPEGPRPAVSLKVLYDPYNANAGTATLESTPYEQPAPAEALSESEAPAAPAPAPAAPQAPAFSFEGYPADFHTEVFCPGPQLSELSALLPWGADVLGIAGEYYWIAREAGTIDAARSHAVFPLRYTQDGTRHEARIEMRRRNGSGASWAIEAVHTESEEHAGTEE